MLFVLSGFAALLFPAVAPAQGSGERQFGPWIWGIQGGAVEQFDTGLSDRPGDFSVRRLFIQPSVGYFWDRRHTVSLAVGIGDSKYDFSPDAAVGGQRPWGRIRDYRVSVPIRFSPSERTDAIIIPSVRSNAEEGASVNDGRTEGVLAGIGWKLSDSLTLGPGFGWFSELGGGSNAFPILVIDWAITDKLSLTTGGGMAASQGPGLTLNYSLNDKWTAGLTGRYEQIRFALANDGTSPGVYGQDESLPLVLRVEYSPWPLTSLGVFVGGEFEGELSLEDADGRTVARSDYDTAPLAGLFFRSRF
jgi:hypothetical protein